MTEILCEADIKDIDDLPAIDSHKYLYSFGICDKFDGFYHIQYTRDKKLVAHFAKQALKQNPRLTKKDSHERVTYHIECLCITKEEVEV